MNLDQFVYPSKAVPRPGGDFVVRQFILPIEIGNEILWAMLDTGANVSILPRELAREFISLRSTEDIDGEYTLAGVVNVPYQTYNLETNLLNHISGTIEELNLEPYETDSVSKISLNEVEFQVPTLSWAEIAHSLEANGETSISTREMRRVILGLHGVIDQVNLSITNDNCVTVQPYGQP